MRKRILSAITAILTLVTCILSTGITVSARGIFDDAVTMNQLQLYNIKLDKGEHRYYKITIPADGSITFRNADSSGGAYSSTGLYLRLLNENAEAIIRPGYSSTNMYANIYIMGQNSSYSYTNLKRGTYYLNIYNSGNVDNRYVNDFYYTFTPDDPKYNETQPAANNNAAVLRITVTMYNGDVLELGTTVGADRARWRSSRSTVASVSSNGLATARSAGTAIIEANVDGRVVRIAVVVRD
ncbi:MAG: Ig-like domain-containing protein [Oscillospiraceae bacterium]|nr:Ig-like domain-containing protein [Oscillospiraceae bacterium]